MAEKNPEMSLDDVLSSIRKMVIDDEPPVLDLTDMVKPDGSIVKIKAADSENQDISSFLKLAQKNADSISEPERERKKEEYIERQLQKAPIVSTDVTSPPFSSREDNSAAVEQDKKEAIMELLKEIAVPLINKWIRDNLPEITKKIVDDKIRECLKRMSD
jgi:cell pole-organizing protein PopZ